MKNERFSLIVACAASAIAGASLMAVFGMAPPPTDPAAAIDFRTPANVSDPIAIKTGERENRREATLRIAERDISEDYTRIGPDRMPAMAAATADGFVLVVTPNGQSYVVDASGQALSVWKPGTVTGIASEFDPLKNRPFNLRYSHHLVDWNDIYPEDRP